MILTTTQSIEGRTIVAMLMVTASGTAVRLG